MSAPSFVTFGGGFTRGVCEGEIDGFFAIEGVANLVFASLKGVAKGVGFIGVVPFKGGDFGTAQGPAWGPRGGVFGLWFDTIAPDLDYAALGSQGVWVGF